MKWACKVTSLWKLWADISLWRTDHDSLICVIEAVIQSGPYSICVVVVGHIHNPLNCMLHLSCLLLFFSPPLRCSLIIYLCVWESVRTKCEQKKRWCIVNVSHFIMYMLFCLFWSVIFLIFCCVNVTRQFVQICFFDCQKDCGCTKTAEAVISVMAKQ